jgi:O-antigen/teichoic acid export membrane protein
MNLFAYWAFTVLFTPNAARSFARSDDAELSAMYWQTAAWMTMLTLPILLMTFSFANVLVPTVYGSQYGSSAAILAILSTAYFINTAFGFNGLTVRVFHKLRWVVGVDLSMAALNIIANIILIPRFGPVGAACGTAMTVVIHTILRHVGLKRYTGVPVFSRKYAGLYLTIGFLAPCLFIIQLAIGLSLPGALILAGIGTLIAFTINRRSLRLDVLFPELARLPFLRRLTGAN